MKKPLLLLMLLCGVVWIASCATPGPGSTGDDDTVASDDDTGDDDAVQPIECLGSVYGDAPSIDPDYPIYDGEDYTQQEVTEAFAEARAQNSYAYQAYRIARDNPELMECAFCSCGCAVTEGHISAVDCFKDMHGFT